MRDAGIYYLILAIDKAESCKIYTRGRSSAAHPTPTYNYGGTLLLGNYHHKDINC